jgi:predicted dehydrogenase
MARIGVIGCGAVADFGHIPAILKTSGLELSALYDPLPGRAQEYANKFGGQPFEDIEQFYTANLDAVVICSPLKTHFEQVMLASEKGVHVLCEKPIATDEDEAADMIAVMEDSGKAFFVTFVYRFSESIRQIRRWMREKVIGDTKHIRMIYLWDLHGEWEQTSSGQWTKSPRWRGRMLEGGPLIDCGVHQIDLIRWLTGKEVRTYEAFGAWVSEYDAPDHILSFMQLESGITASVEVSFTYGHTSKDPLSIFSYEVIGTGGVARFDRNGYILEARSGEKLIQLPGHGEKDFDGMYRAFAHFLNTGEQGDLASPQDAMIATEIATACTDQAIQKRLR